MAFLSVSLPDISFDTSLTMYSVYKTYLDVKSWFVWYSRLNHCRIHLIVMRFGRVKSSAGFNRLVTVLTDKMLHFLIVFFVILK